MKNIMGKVSKWNKKESIKNEWEMLKRLGNYLKTLKIVMPVSTKYYTFSIIFLRHDFLWNIFKKGQGEVIITSVSVLPF